MGKWVLQKYYITRLFYIAKKFCNFVYSDNFFYKNIFYKNNEAEIGRKGRIKKNKKQKNNAVYFFYNFTYKRIT